MLRIVGDLGNAEGVFLHILFRRFGNLQCLKARLRRRSAVRYLKAFPDTRLNGDEAKLRARQRVRKNFHS